MQRSVKEADIPLKAKLSDNFKVCKLIARSHISKLYKVKHVLTNQKFAAKQISKNKIRTEDQRKSIFKEISFLRSVDHPNIVKLIDFFQDTRYYYIITELSSQGNILSSLISSYVSSEHSVCEYFKQVLSALVCSHESNTILCNFSPLHIRNNKRDVLKIVDFGEIQKVRRNKFVYRETAFYTSPEALDGCFSKNGDLWSLGVLLYTILCGYPPFYGQSSAEMYSKIKEARLEFPREEWDYISYEAKDLVQKLIKSNPYERIGLRGIADHPWVKRPSKLKFNRFIDSKIKQNLRAFLAEVQIEQATNCFVKQKIGFKQRFAELKSQFNDCDRRNSGVVSLRTFSQVVGNTDVKADTDGMVAYKEYFETLVQNKHRHFLQILHNQVTTIQEQSENELDQSGNSQLCNFRASISDDRKDDRFWEKLIDDTDAKRNGQFDIHQIVNSLYQQT